MDSDGINCVGGSDNDAAAAAQHNITPSCSTTLTRSLDRQQLQQQQQQNVDSNDKSPNSIGSNVSSITSSSTTSSPPQYSEDLRHNVQGLDLLPRQSSVSSSKTCEVDLGDEERDTFSPVSSSNNSPTDVECDAASADASNIDGLCNGAGAASNVPPVDNKVYDVSPLSASKRKLVNGLTSSLHTTTSKAEKQRQNEEIVIMETSSISSETGSWESVFPHVASPAAVDVRVCCTDFLQNERDEQQPKSKERKISAPFRDECMGSPLFRERTYSTGASTADTSSLFASGSAASVLRDLDRRENALSTSGTSACFIDASSLRDEDEVLSFPSLEGQQEHLNDEQHADGVADTDEQENESPTKKLESFHMLFEKCKRISKDMEKSGNLSHSSSSSSHSDSDSPQKPISGASATSTNNLSDEEKLWKREHESQRSNPAAKDSAIQLDKDTHHDDVTEASVSLAADLDSSDSSDIIKLRREQERKQSTGIFPHHTQHFTIHPLGASPKFSHHGLSAAPPCTLGNVAHPIQSDLSYTTDYSSSSPAPSLVWSENEHRLNTNTRQHVDGFESPMQKPCLIPDTPHNSIVHIDPTSSNTSSIHRDYTLSSSFSHQRDSGAYCSDATDSPIPMPRTPKRSKFDEANPIVSGGASIKDFSIKQCESPTIKRRTETCPIVSGGFVSLDFEHARPLEDDDEEEEVELRVKHNPRKPVSSIASWVVDMSDCKPERRKSTSSTSSMENSTARVRERSDSTSSHKSGCGFYVSLTDMDRNPSNEQNVTETTAYDLCKSYSTPKSTGFFVNLSQSERSANEQKTPEAKSEETQDKKNIFSMFIDFGEKKAGTPSKKEPFNLAQRLSSSLTSAQRRTEDQLKSSASSTETLMSKSSNMKSVTDNDGINGGGESKSLDYKCNIDTPPTTVAALRRISQQHRAQNDPTKRHSWGNNQPSSGATNDCKRSISLTTNGDSKENGNGLMSIIDKLPIISKTSSLSIDSSVSPYDEYLGSKSDISTCSNNSVRNSMSGEEREDNVHQNAAPVKLKKRRRDVQINETFDKSSLASITDGVLSKDLSPASTTDTDDLTFQQDEELAIREVSQHSLSQVPSNRTSAIIMETIIEAKEVASPKKSATGHVIESLHATVEKQKMMLETVNENSEVGKSSFVKLSDMDKPIKFDLQTSETMMSKSAGNHRPVNRLYRDDSTKGRPHSWTMTRSTGNSFFNITNSVENIRSLSRIFPNFSKEFSNSLPNDIVLEQTDYIQTDLSADSSLASSFSRSGMDESSISCRQPRRLGEDLLKMFLQEIATDMIVEVNGRRIKAHKCILRSRCPYFAAMLAGTGAQSVVSLQGYSYSAVHFALCHIYSGASHPPDGISLMELAALADLLGLEGLKDVIAHALKMNYCHNFHKPCSGCIDGILQVLPVALNHSLDDLYRKCLRWTCRHYLKVWPTRQFAQLPPDILGRCRQLIIAYLSSESVLNTILDCEALLTQLVSYRWGSICEKLIRDILDAAYGYLSDHFASLIASDAFLSLGHDRSCSIPHLEGLLLRIASTLTPDQACRSYQRVTRLNTVLQAKLMHMPANLSELARELQGLQEEDLDWDPEYIRLVSEILSAVEQCLIRQCSRAMRVTSWQRMDLELRKKIQSLARLTEPLDMKRSNGKPVAKAYSFGGNTRNQDLYQIKLAMQAHTRRAMAQDTQLYKATQTQDAGNVQTIERGVQANHDLREGNSKILKSNSRAHVPQTYRASSQSATVSERNSINTHRRTQSEAPLATTKSIAVAQPQKVNDVKVEATKPKERSRLTEVRPRYLEPRKPRALGSGPVRSATSSSIPATRDKLHRQISSSDSSRNESPAARKLSDRIGTRSKNMSLDSLASPSRRARTLRSKATDNERYSDRGGDSVTESMKSSIITNKAISQESLANGNKLTRSNPVIGNDNRSLSVAVSKSTQGSRLNGNIKQSSKLSNGVNTKPPKHLQPNIISTGSSPSSAATTKSATSRLSSVSSTHSTRDMFKNRSISVPAGQETAGQRRSFLSAKSREILAKRAEKNKQLQLQQQQQMLQANSSGDEKSVTTTTTTSSGPLRSASNTAVNALSTATNNRNSLPSSIPTRRTANVQQVKKSNTTTNNNNNNSSSRTNALNNKNKTAKITAQKEKVELIITNTGNMATMEASPTVVETKLERSITFCKESSDLDLNDLHIID